MELGPFGIRVNAVAPGSILTEATARILSDKDRAERPRVIPGGRLGRPADVAEAVAYLASDAAGCRLLCGPDPYLAALPAVTNR